MVGVCKNTSFNININIFWGTKLKIVLQTYKIWLILEFGPRLSYFTTASQWDTLWPLLWRSRLLRQSSLQDTLFSFTRIASKASLFPHHHSCHLVFPLLLPPSLQTKSIARSGGARLSQFLSLVGSKLPKKVIYPFQKVKYIVLSIKIRWFVCSICWVLLFRRFTVSHSGLV